MPTASGARVRMAYVKEVTQGVNPGGTTKILRTTSRQINLQKNILESNEVRADRQKKDVRHGFLRVAGALGFELSIGAYDDMIEGLLGGTWTTVATQGAPNLGATSPATFTRAAGSWIADGIRAGDMITTTGYTAPADNGTFRVLTVGATTLVCDTSVLITEANGAAKTLVATGKRIEIGTTLETFTFERQFLDLPQYQVFSGVAVDSMPLSIKPEAIVNGTLNLVGMLGGTLSGSPISGSPTAAPTNAPFSSFEGRLYENGATIAIVTGLDLLIENHRSLQAIVGTKTSPEVYDGQCMVSGSLTALFQNSTLLNKFLNETGTSLWCKLDDLNGTDFHNIVMPSIKYVGGDIDPPTDGPTPITLPFRSLVDTLTGTSLSWQRSN